MHGSAFVKLFNIFLYVTVSKLSKMILQIFAIFLEMTGIKIMLAKHSMYEKNNY